MSERDVSHYVEARRFWHGNGAAGVKAWCHACEKVLWQSPEGPHDAMDGVRAAKAHQAEMRRETRRERRQAGE